MSDYHTLSEICQQIAQWLPQLGDLRDGYRMQYQLGRELSLAITHLEDAQTRLGNAQSLLLQIGNQHAEKSQ